MSYVTPFKKKDRIVFDSLMRKERFYTSDIHFSRYFGRRYHGLIDRGFLDIAHVNRSGESIFVLRPNTKIMPKKGKFFFYKIF